jgi:hypothetical protein
LVKSHELYQRRLSSMKPPIALIDRTAAVLPWLVAVVAVTVRGFLLGSFVPASVVLAVAGIVLWLFLRRALPLTAAHALQLTAACTLIAVLVPLLATVSYRIWTHFLPLESLLDPPLLTWFRLSTGAGSILLLLPLAGMLAALVGRPAVPGLGWLTKPPFDGADDSRY